MNKDHTELFSLQDRVVVITGAAGYLGEMHTRAVLDAGGIPAMIDTNEAGLAEVARSLRETYGTERIHAYACSITDPQAVSAIRDDLDTRYGRIDGLINNACFNPTMKGPGSGAGRIESIDKARWDMEMDVGLYGAFCCSRIFGEYMAAHGGGSIVNISSDLGVIAPNQSLYTREGVPADEQPKKPVTYSVIKFGLIGMTKYFSTYWAKEGVRANAVAFGGVFNDQSKEFTDRVEALIPMGRMARRDEYMGTIVYMLSNASSYMTGAVLSVDGGRTAW